MYWYIFNVLSNFQILATIKKPVSTERKISKNGFFYCVNRYYKDLVGYPVELHRYPFGENWNPLISKQSKLQENTHILLLKKSIKINKKFKSELKKIKKKYIQLKKKDKYLIRRLLPIQIYRIYKLIKFFLIKRWKNLL